MRRTPPAAPPAAPLHSDSSCLSRAGMRRELPYARLISRRRRLLVPTSNFGLKLVPRHLSSPTGAPVSQYPPTSPYTPEHRCGLHALRTLLADTPDEVNNIIYHRLASVNNLAESDRSLDRVTADGSRTVSPHTLQESKAAALGLHDCFCFAPDFLRWEASKTQMVPETRRNI